MTHTTQYPTTMYPIGDLQIPMFLDQVLRFAEFANQDPTLRSLLLLEAKILDFRAYLASGHEVQSTMEALNAMHEDRMVYQTNAVVVIQEWLEEDAQEYP